MTYLKKTPSENTSEASLMCSAHGCPMKWSVDPGQLCSYHAFVEPKEWPSITESLRRDGPWELTRKTSIDLSKYQDDPRGWAKRLRDMHQSGEHLSAFQVSSYQSALRLTA